MLFWVWGVILLTLTFESSPRIRQKPPDLNSGVGFFFPINKFGCLVVFCLFHLYVSVLGLIWRPRETKQTYIFTWPVAKENTPDPLPEARKLASSHLAVGLWASHAQEGRPSETSFSVFFFLFTRNVFLCLSLCTLFGLFVLSYKFFFDS